MKIALTYDDILLVPQYSNIESRKEVEIGNSLDYDRWLELPVISSPMDSITEAPMAMAMARAGAMGVLHRYNDIEEQRRMVREFRIHMPNSYENCAAAVGTSGDYLERAITLFDAGASIICIDVAHGHHSLVERAIKSIRDKLGDGVHIMAGNIATAEGYLDLASWGADSIRCNVGGGSICSTRIQTGHGMPGLQTIIDCASVKGSAKIIADGGIRSSGDIVKAYAAGADFVMVGSLLAGTDETPGNIITAGTAGTKEKVYRGMASKEAQMDWRGAFSSNEGIATKVAYKGPVRDVLSDLINGIRSGFSYSGCKNMKEFRRKSKFVRQTTAGLRESRTHILGR
jgi:IMP dehydrogenase